VEKEGRWGSGSREKVKTPTPNGGCKGTKREKSKEGMKGGHFKKKKGDKKGAH